MPDLLLDDVRCSRCRRHLDSFEAEARLDCGEESCGTKGMCYDCFVMHKCGEGVQEDG